MSTTLDNILNDMESGQPSAAPQPAPVHPTPQAVTAQSVQPAVSTPLQPARNPVTRPVQPQAQQVRQPQTVTQPTQPTQPTQQPQRQMSSQQALRERLMNQNNAQQQQQQAMQQREQQVSRQIVNNEIDEETKPAVNPKIVIGVAVACVAVLGFIIFQFAGKSKEPVQEEVAFNNDVVIPVVEEEPQEELAFSSSVAYTAEQQQQLQAAGATQEQIGEWMGSGVPFNYVYFTLKEQQYAFSLENSLPTYDMASDQYKDIIGDTWMSLPKRTDVEEWIPDYQAYTYEEKQNFDYEKVEPYGNQLFLKVYLDASTHSSWFFLCITPEEWNQLDDEGNVVVNYTYATHYKPYTDLFSAEEDTENIFITSATLDIIESLKNKNGG